MIMKRILLLLCLFVGIYSFSQTHFSKEQFPVLAGLQRTICSGYEREEPEYKYSLSEPTKEIEIDSKHYLQMGVFALREENDKILVYSEIQKKDLVLYDFSLELGDTLTTLNLVTPEHLEYTGTIGVVDYQLSNWECISIDTLIVTELSHITLLNGMEYKRWKFNNGMVYVEDIGVMSGDFFYIATSKLAVPASYLGSHLVCASQDGVLLYQMDQNMMDSLGVECLCKGAVNSVEYKRATQSDNTKFIHNNQLLIQSDGKTYNVMGVEVEK